MRTRSLGGKLPPVTVVGCGDVSPAIAALRGLDHRDVERALHEAIDLGVTLIDVTHEDRVERLAGDAVRVLRARDRVVVACQLPLLMDTPFERDLLSDRLPVKYVQARVEAALRSTRLDVLPLVQLPLHAAWRQSTAWPELVGTCTRLVREGKVMAWGAMLAPGPDVVDLIGDPFTVVIVALSICDRAGESLIEAAAAQKLAVLVRRPLAGGALTGNLAPGVKLEPNDDRHTLDDAALEQIAVGAARLAALVKRDPPAVRSCTPARAARETAVRAVHIECTTVAELALRWAIDHPGVTAILPRLHRREHIAEAISVMAAPPLPADLLARIETIFPRPKPD